MAQSMPKPIHIGQYLDAVYPSYALLAGMQLDLFTALKDGPTAADYIAKSLGVDVGKLRPLLYALVAADLLTLDGDQFANTDESQFYLVRDSPAYMSDIAASIAYMWEAISHTAATVKAGTAQAKIDYSSAEPDENTLAAYQGLHKLSLMSSRDLTSQFDLSVHRHVADIGGGTGGIAMALTHAYKNLRATVIELPSVIPLTQQYIARAPTKDRIDVVAADVVKDPLPGKYDAAVMRAFTQVISPEANQAVFKHTYAALEPGGKLYIIARVLDDSRITPPDTALINLLFLNIYDGGQAFTESEYRGWIEAAGFTNFARHIQGRGDSIIVATRP